MSQQRDNYVGTLLRLAKRAVERKAETVAQGPHVWWGLALGSHEAEGEEAALASNASTRRMRPRSHSAHVIGNIEDEAPQRRDRSFSDPVPPTPSPDAKALAEKLYNEFVGFYDSLEGPEHLEHSRHIALIGEQIRDFFDSRRGITDSMKGTVYIECYGLLCRDMKEAHDELEDTQARASDRAQLLQTVYDTLGPGFGFFMRIGVATLEKKELKENGGVTAQELFDFSAERADDFLELQAEITNPGIRR